MTMRKALTSVAVAAAAAGLLAIPGTAHAGSPVPLPPALANHPFAKAWTGADLKAWGPGPNMPGNCASNNSETTVLANGDLQESTTGTSGDCTDVESPHTYPTLNGYVYEEQVYFNNLTQWNSFWMYGNSWPTDGEIDSFEGGPGTSFMSYHFAAPPSSPPFSYSTCNSTNSCDGNAAPIQSGPSSPDITPGWHTVDISYGDHGAGQGQVSVWYDGVLYGSVFGANVLKGGTHPGYWITTGTGSCSSASNGNVCGSAGQTSGVTDVRYLRVFT